MRYGTYPRDVESARLSEVNGSTNHLLSFVFQNAYNFTTKLKVFSVERQKPSMENCKVLPHKNATTRLKIHEKEQFSDLTLNSKQRMQPASS